MSNNAYITADDFFDSRRDWLRVAVVEVETNCFDIVLKLDGTYFDRDTAREVAQSFQRDIAYLVNHLDPTRLLKAQELK